MTDRTGQLWARYGIRGRYVGLVLGPPINDGDIGDLLHRVVILESPREGAVGAISEWLEFPFVVEWDNDAEFTRLA